MRRPSKQKPIGRLMDAVEAYGFARRDYATICLTGGKLGKQVEQWNEVGARWKAIRRLALKLLREANALQPLRPRKSVSQKRVARVTRGRGNA